MDVIELECPHCGDALELDAAFAGGVCRCSTCGTLMTVPADPSRDRAETVTRRDRPDAPAGGRRDTPAPRPDTPGSGGFGGSGGRPDRPQSPGPGARPDVPGGDVRSEAPVEAEADDDIYVTASGKSLKLAEAVVPTARKRKKVIRATVIAAFVAFVLVLIGVIILAINLLLSTGQPKNTDAPDIVGIDPAINPILKPEANIIGIPIASESAIIVDSTSSGRQWYSMMREIIGHEVALASATDFMVIPWTDLSAKSFPGAKPQKIGRDKLSELDSFLTTSTVGDAIDPLPFVELALAERADQILLVIGRRLEPSEIEALGEAVSRRVDTRLDIVLIGDHNEQMQDLAKANNGKYVSIKVDQLQTWFDQWKKGGK